MVQRNARKYQWCSVFFNRNDFHPQRRSQASSQLPSPLRPICSSLFPPLFLLPTYHLLLPKKPAIFFRLRKDPKNRIELFCLFVSLIFLGAKKKAATKQQQQQKYKGGGTVKKVFRATLDSLQPFCFFFFCSLTFFFPFFFLFSFLPNHLDA